MRPTPVEIGRRLRKRDRSAAPAALNLIEDRTPAARAGAAELLAEVSPAALGGEAPAHLIGVTGPPGAGKSSLLSVLAAVWRARGRTVAVLAVDPSSKRSGGALLGDRARIEHDPHDDGILIRSTAAGGRLGGLAASTREAVEALAAAFDVVVVETVGVGQSETDVEDVTDTVVVVVQPASGDTLQFLKAGIMEVPDVLVVTKADLGAPADRARRDLTQALAAVGSRGQHRSGPGQARPLAHGGHRSGPGQARPLAHGGHRSGHGVPVLAVSSLPPGTGVEDLADALEARRGLVDVAERRVGARRSSALRELQAEHGERALRALGGRRAAERVLAGQDPGATTAELVRLLEERIPA